MRPELILMHFFLCNFNEVNIQYIIIQLSRLTRVACWEPIWINRTNLASSIATDSMLLILLNCLCGSDHGMLNDTLDYALDTNCISVLFGNWVFHLF